MRGHSFRHLRDLFLSGDLEIYVSNLGAHIGYVSVIWMNLQSPAAERVNSSIALAEIYIGLLPSITQHPASSHLLASTYSKLQFNVCQAF